MHHPSRDALELCVRDRTLKKHTREGRFHTAAAQFCFVFAPKDGDEDGGGFTASRQEQEQEQQQEDAGGLSGFTTKAHSSGSGTKRSIPRGAGFGRARRQRR